MKKYIFSLIIILSVLFTFNSVYAKAPLADKTINAIVAVLRVYKVDKLKITRIVNILKENETPTSSINATSAPKTQTPAKCLKKCPISA